MSIKVEQPFSKDEVVDRVALQKYDLARDGRRMTRTIEAVKLQNGQVFERYSAVFRGDRGDRDQILDWKESFFDEIKFLVESATNNGWRKVKLG